MTRIKMMVLIMANYHVLFAINGSRLILKRFFYGLIKDEVTSARNLRVGDSSIETISEQEWLLRDEKNWEHFHNENHSQKT